MKQWLEKNWLWAAVDVAIVGLAVFVLVGVTTPQEIAGLFAPRPHRVDVEALRAAAPSTTEEWEEALTASIAAGGDYLVRHQLSNGELPYELYVVDGQDYVEPSGIRLVAGAGSLFTVCRVTGDQAYCRAGDAALARYFGHVVEREGMPGACFYSEGMCRVGGSALAIDVVHKRWRATGDTTLDGTDLLDTALQLGENLSWLRQDDGSLLHGFDPHTGLVNFTYHDRFFTGESLMATLELYEMTGDPRWLEEARETNAYMLRQEVTRDHWHAYSFWYLARLDDLTEADVGFANDVGQAFGEVQMTWRSDLSAISAASMVEGSAALALALEAQGEPHEWLVPELENFALYVMAHQLPDHPCQWPETADFSGLEGGIISTCEDPAIRIDGVQHWINGADTFLEYLRQTR